MTNLYLTTIPDTLTGDTIKRMHSLVSPERSARARRFLKERDRLRSLTGEILLRRILRDEYGVLKPVFKAGKYGKPLLESGELFFNISHAGPYVLLATGDMPVGVDIEVPRQVSEGVGEMVFTEGEQRWISRSPNQQDAFLKLWTLKEAYIKAIGLGLHKPLQEISFAIADRHISVRDAGEPSLPERLFFTQGIHEGSYWALCSEECAAGMSPVSLAFDELLLPSFSTTQQLHNKIL